MFEPQLARIRDKMEKVGEQSGRFILNLRATPAQIAKFEAELGLTLPDEYREWISQIGDGYSVGLLQIGALFPTNAISPNHTLRTYKTVFPLKHTEHPGWEMFYLFEWNQLNGHEKMETNVALAFGMWRGRSLPALVISGEQRAQVWHGCVYDEPTEAEDLNPFDSLSFLDWLEQILDL